VEGHLLASTGAEGSVVRVWTNGSRHEAQVFDSRLDGPELRFDLAAELHGMGAAGALVIEFDITDPQRPIDHGMGADTRALGFYLEHLSLAPRVALAPAPAKSPGGRAWQRHLNFRPRLA
jgi:hypothetical protein